MLGVGVVVGMEVAMLLDLKSRLNVKVNSEKKWPFAVIEKEQKEEVQKMGQKDSTTTSNETP
uniref:Uncharacterized protein n=1 Tax=Magallana gigas TaxID=29159 RepID=K1P1E1_MAGGI